MNSQGTKKRGGGYKRSNNVDSDRWDHSGLEELEKERKHERKPQIESTKSDTLSNTSSNYDDHRSKPVSDKWVHDKTQGEFTPRGFYGKNSRRPDRVLYKHPAKQGKQYSKNETADEFDEKPYAKDIEEREPNLNVINDDGISVVSNASTNVSSEKIKFNADDNKYDDRAQTTLIKQVNDTLGNTENLNAAKESAPILFFELNITFSEDLTGELRIYEKHEGLISMLEEFCQKFNMSEENSLYIRIFVLKQLSDTKYPDFARLEDYYRGLLEENYNLLVSSQIKSNENEELASPSTQKNL